MSRWRLSASALWNPTSFFSSQAYEPAAFRGKPTVTRRMIAGSDTTASAMTPDLIKQTYLVRAGAGRIKHSGRSLLDHLLGTRDLLRRWDAPNHVQDAGLFHSVFGTTAFQRSLLADVQRGEVRDLIGPRAYQLIENFAGLRRGLRLLQGIGAEQVPDVPSAIGMDLAVLEAANLYDQGRGEAYFRRLLALADTLPLLSKVARSEIAARVPLRGLREDTWACVDFGTTVSRERCAKLSSAIASSLQHQRRHPNPTQSDVEERRHIRERLRTVGLADAPLTWVEIACIGINSG